jgi:hypothetical protein
MPYTKDELKSELLRCYENEGTITSKILNSPDNDYPTQMTYYNYFGSLAEAKSAVDIIAGYRKNEVLSDIRKCYEKYNEVSTSVLDNDDELVNYSTVYKHYGSLEDAVKEADISWDNAKTEHEGNKKYSRDELIQNLIDCKEEKGDTKTSTVDNFDGPTSGVYRDRFGSLTEARKVAQIEESFKNGKNGKVKRLVKSADVDKDADAIIYVLEITVNNETAYYVGETTDIKSRLRSHVYRTRIQTWAHGTHGKILAPRTKSGELNEIEVKSIEYTIPLYKNKDESDIGFRRRRKYREHHEHLSVAIDNNTLDVYGGR